MFFRDDYTDFTFNQIHSSSMGVWITHSNDLQFNITPDFSNSYVKPDFSDTRYYTGTSVEKSTLSIKCVADKVTMAEWRAISNWLSPFSVGRLQFDFNIGTYYEAKVASAIKATTTVRGGHDPVKGDTYIIEFTINFETVGDWAARTNTAYWNGENDYSTRLNKYLVPEIVEKTFNKKSPFLNTAGLILQSKPKESLKDIKPTQIYSNGVNIYQLQWENDGSGCVCYSSSSEQIIIFSFGPYEIFNMSGLGDSLILCDNFYDMFDVIPNGNFSFYNAGNFPSSPVFHCEGNSSNNISISQCGEKFYDYRMNPLFSQTRVDIDGKNGAVLFNGVLVERALAIVNGLPVYRVDVSSLINKGRMTIEGGRPEIHRSTVLDANWYPDEKKQVIKIIKPAFIYDRFKPYGLCISSLRPDANPTKYAQSKYAIDTENASELDDLLTFSTLLEDFLITDNNDGTMTLEYYREDNEKTINDPIYKGLEIYISLCDREDLQIDANEINIEFHTREVF